MSNLTPEQIEALLDKQEEIGEVIKTALKNIKKLPTTSRTVDTLQKCSDKLESDWLEFKRNHAILAPKLTATDDYLKQDYQSEVHNYVKDCRTVIEKFMNVALNGDGTSTQIPINNSLKNQEFLLKSFNKILDGYNSMNSSQKTLNVMKETKQRLQQNWKTIQQLHDRMLMSVDAYDATEFISTEEKLSEVLKELGIFDQANDRASTSSTHTSNQSENLKLPKITVPTFDGDYLKWTAFQELFCEMIGSKNISGTQKLIYLKQNVSGEAGKLVQHLQVTEANYNIAWKALEGRYNNQRLIIAALLNNIFSMDHVKSESANSLKKLHDIVIENINALNSLNLDASQLSSIMFHHVIVKKLDEKSHALYEQSLDNSHAIQTLPELMVFIEKRFQALEAVGRKHKQSNHNSNQNSNNNHGNFNQKAKIATALIASNGQYQKRACECKDDHPLYKCPAFLKLSTNDRFKRVKELRRCINCLKDRHAGKTKCPSRKCSTCGKAHNTLLHFEAKQALLGSAVNNPDFEHVFLATAIIHVIDQYGNMVKTRVLLDSGSQVSMMTEKMHNKIGIKCQSTSMKIAGVGNNAIVAKKRAVIQIQSQHSNFNSQLEIFVVKAMTSCQPAKHVNIDDWAIPNEVELADPQFNIPSNIDLVIGGELFYKLLSNGLINIGEGLPDLQNTVFGWVVIGKLLGLKTSEVFAGISIRDGQQLDDQLTKFWQVEEKFKPAQPFTESEMDCERFYEETTRRDTNGRFIVKLQFIKEPSSLGSSEEMAVRRFFYLEKRFVKDPGMKAEYSKFMHEYEALGHMEEVDRSSLGDHHYIIPHHYVLNPGSSTTKFRVVFDASAKTTSNLSLNQIMAKGPILQEDLFSIMVRFRKHQYVFSADIGKMYRQINVDPTEINWQVIVWRNNPSEKLKYYKLKTLTYGVTCSSYLAIKTLQHLADIERENYPLAATVSKRDFNVDDIMTGTNDIYEAVQLQDQLVDMLKLAGLELHKWCANHPMLLENIPKSKQEVSLDINSEKEETKALGMKWIPRTDKFMLSYKQRDHKSVTKRTVLAETAQLFDPLGLVNPVIVLAKIFMQELWSKKMDWDEKLSPEVQSKWVDFRKELTKLNQVIVPRNMVIKNAVNIQLHAFSDASIRAYGTAIYIRSENSDGEVQVHLVCSKSRVAPVDPLTLPRLELCGAVLMAEMVEKLEKVLQIKFDKILYWTDSEIVLSWIYADTTYKTFVANRVASIKRKTRIENWRYIETKSNPADLISRGVLPEKLNELWWHGPKFLQHKEDQWPAIKPSFIRVESEERIIKTVLLAAEGDIHFISRINHRNSIRTLNNIVAYCMRLDPKHRSSCIQKGFGLSLSVPELQAAMIQIVKYCQSESFAEDIQHIKEGNPHKTSFSNLSPFLDHDDVIRVGGRIQAADISYEQKHPALLPKNHEITRLIMERIHRKNMHTAPQALLALTRLQYWPLNGKRLAQSVVKQCVLCARSKPKLMGQIMGNLPAERVNTSRVFAHTGIDFAGPIMIHYKVRGKKCTKSYICLFVCFATKAIHIEAAPDLTTAGFINCLKRFIARRGLPLKIFCDNAKTFEGSRNQLVELAALMQSEYHQKKVINYSLDHQIQWNFIPPRSAHFGGLWEAAIKSAKLHLIKILHNKTLTYDELSTTLAEIEAILNSRPLTQMSSDPNDLKPLTAGHFLIGAPLVSINDEALVPNSKQQMWEKLRAIKGEFWNRWSKEYLAELQYRNKWTEEKPNIQVGTMVTLREDNIPPLKWRMGRVVSTKHGIDGKIRVVEVLTKTGIFKRSIHQVSPLPVGPMIMQEPDVVQSKKASTSKTVKTQPTAVSEKPTSSGKQLNPAATEFTPLASQRQNKRKIKTQVSKDNSVEAEVLSITSRLRSFNKKQTKTKPCPEIPTASAKTTKPKRSRKTAALSSIVFLIIGLLTLVVGITGAPCEVTTFKSNPGLYFEEIGQLSLTNDEWNLICYVRMDGYWLERKNIKRIISDLSGTCPKLHTQDYCDITLGQLKHQITLIDRKNELIKDFSYDRVSRKRRGWFNGVGTAAKEVFGIMDAEDARCYSDEIRRLDKYGDRLMELIRNQTTMQDITSNIIHHDEEVMANHLKHMQEEISKLANNASGTKLHEFLHDIHKTMPSEQPSSGMGHVINWEEFQLNPDMDVLKKAISTQNENSRFESNSHDVHHYTMTYVILGLIITSGAFYWYKRCRNPAHNVEMLKIPISTPGASNKETVNRNQQKPHPQERFNRSKIVDSIFSSTRSKNQV